MTPEQALQTYFGFPSFRNAQKDIIDSVISGKDSVVIMPTGAGKSLCYQIPALCMPGITIVISPLIALMKDQVDNLKKLNVPATFINSSLTPGDIALRIEAIKAGEYKLVYIAPERFNDFEFIPQLEGLEISLFAIDESHCISEWGHDFRPSYSRLNKAINQLGRPTVIALTATATPEVRDDIIRQLDLVDYELYVTGFDRPNLDFQVYIGSKEDKLSQLLDFIKSQDGTGIVYAGTRNNAEEIAEILSLHDINAINYHAGLIPEDRKKYQEAFMNGEHDVIVATNAFGMGVDKSNIRYVCHFDMPGTLEAYYQEAGRAGRDGKQSTCILYYNPSDRYLREFFLKSDNPSRDNIKEVYDVLTKYPSEPILMTYNEIKSYLSDTVPDMTVGTAIKILDKANYIDLRGENQKEAYIQFKYSLTDVLEQIGGRAKNKLTVATELYGIFGEEILHGIHSNLEDVFSKSALKRDSFMRALNDLNKKELIEYEPPFRGKEIFIKQRVDPEDLDLDWRTLEQKLERDLGKLNQMEGYVYHQGDKKQYILDYFGDKN